MEEKRLVDANHFMQVLKNIEYFQQMFPNY